MFWSHPCFAAMVKNSWPTGVTSWTDTVKFAQLLFGSDVQFENYSHLLPHNSTESFLLFAKGACKEPPRPFSCIRELIAVQLEEIKEYEIARRGNVSEKSGKIAADDEAHGQEGVLL